MAFTKHLIALFGTVVLVLGPTTASSLLGTSILFRHGERTPVISFANLKCSTCGDIPPGQLTQAGSLKMYEIGTMLRLKYLSLLPKDAIFNKKHMQIVSSKPDRCIMSLKSFMAGFLPQPQISKALPIHWQPYTFDVDYNGRVVYLNSDSLLCPRFWKDVHAYLASPNSSFAQWLAEDRQALKEAAVTLGTKIDTVQDVMKVSDSLKVLQFVDPKMPKWAKDLFNTTFKKYCVLLEELLYSTQNSIRIRGGPLLNQIVENMEALASGSSSAKKILIFSAHDVTLSSLSFVLGVQDQIPEPISFGDTIMVDLTENTTGEPSVEVVYMDNANTVSHNIKLNVPGCGISCRLSVFKSAVQDMLLSDDQLDAACGL